MRAALILSLLSACRTRTPTYHADVAPIIERHCRSCHRPGGVAPVPLMQDYANARVYAQPIRVAVQTRRMPPWGADNTGLCGTWKDARWLGSDEITTITRWQEAGAPEGDPAPPPPPAPAPSPPFRADASLPTPLYRPGLGAGGYRCFVADPGLDRDRLLSAIRVSAPDARGLAQLTLFALDSAAADAEAATLDAADATPGYSCFGTARVRDARLVASWTWPEPVLRLPGGVRLGAGRKMVVRLHYNITMPSADWQTATRVDLELDGSDEVRVLPVAAEGTLAPGRRYVAVEKQQPVTSRLEVVGVAPRMHIRGETLHLTVERNGRSLCLGDFDHWRFENQQLFRADKPMRLEPGDRLRIACAYGTLGRTQPVRFGDGIDDEECVAYLFVRER